MHIRIELRAVRHVAADTDKRDDSDSCQQPFLAVERTGIEAVDGGKGAAVQAVLFRAQ